MSYDADTQTYSYRDSDGSYWEGAPGCKYGKLYRVLNAAPPLPSIHIPANPAALEQQYVLVKDCVALRRLLRGFWREAAYHKWNVAAAGAMAKLGVAMVQRTCSAMSVDFPLPLSGHQTLQVFRDGQSRYWFSDHLLI
jgi:hypothetical protein